MVYPSLELRKERKKRVHLKKGRNIAENWYLRNWELNVSKFGGEHKPINSRIHVNHK